MDENFVNGAVTFGDFETSVNDLGEFKLSEFPAGDYSLRVRNNTDEIVIENVKLA